VDAVELEVVVEMSTWMCGSVIQGVAVDSRNVRGVNVDVN
jgi:hypothetical protein